MKLEINQGNNGQFATGIACTYRLHNRVSVSRLYLKAFFPNHTYIHQLDSFFPPGNICIKYDPWFLDQSIFCPPRIITVYYRYSWLLRAENTAKKRGFTLNERCRLYGCKNLRMFKLMLKVIENMKG